jgi:hypothetical protein
MKHMIQFLRRIKPCLLKSLIGTVVLGSVLGASGQSLTIGAFNELNLKPFDVGFGPTASSYEQVYNSADFSGDLDISQISFFAPTWVSGTWGPATYTFHLSTTSVGVGALTGFASDVGANNQLFGSFTLSESVPVPQITFSGTTFDYNPSQGNLLLQIAITDVTGSSGGEVPFEAMEEGPNPPGSLLMSRGYGYGDVFGSDDIALVTEFGTGPGSVVTQLGTGTSYPPLPDASSSLGLLSGACLALGALRR